MRNQSRIVYVIRSVNHPIRYYTGLTDNVERRLAVHNSGGSAYTATLRPWVLVAFTVFSDPESAAEFERYLKTGSGRAFSKRHFK
jgi:predicted GIY-YIG superfamily endonuclease